MPGEREVLRPVAMIDVVIHELTAAIAAGEYGLGDRLPPEAKLGARLGASRSVVREALGVLRARGVLETRNGVGTFVRSSVPGDPKEFGGFSARDLQEVRHHLEVPAAGYAAERHTAAQLAACQQLVQAMEAETDPMRWVDLDARFHVALAAASGNPVFAREVESLRIALAQQSRFINQLDGRIQESNAEHRRIVQAVAARNAAAARRAQATHLSRVQDALDRLTAQAPGTDT
ncbi:MAG: FCD domain-containing protein [Bifidobacteriaceae bacterium]|jgi:DNA-binding FadR family transcriptional regulator|nr:FCD domain-containing protein [Bifidobacteriaceae bacterium]